MRMTSTINYWIKIQDKHGLHFSQIIYNYGRRTGHLKKRLIPIRHQQHILAQNDQVISAQSFTWYPDSHGISVVYPRNCLTDTSHTDHRHGKLGFSAFQLYCQPQHVLHLALVPMLNCLQNIQNLNFPFNLVSTVKLKN